MPLQRVLDEVRPMVWAVPLDLGVAVVNDLFRLGGAEPVPRRTWLRWAERGQGWAEQVAWLAHVMLGTSLRAWSIGRVRAERLQQFFDAIQPLTGEMLARNRFRQEELLRRWAEVCDARIEGETAEVSAARLDVLDYRQVLAAYAASAQQSEAPTGVQAGVEWRE
jgi:hypothetical protein